MSPSVRSSRPDLNLKLPPPAAPLTEEEIRESTVGEPLPFDGRVVVAAYDPRWPAIFEEEAARIRSALGARALSIEHVGSTSVPGLPAKPIVDVDLLVADSADESGYVPALSATGYVLRIREPRWYEHRCFTGPAAAMHLHVFTVGSEEAQRRLLFRNWLRSSTVDRELYAAVKLELSRRKWRSLQEYGEAKVDVVVKILSHAGCI